jgi:hypothetical protein
LTSAAGSHHLSPLEEIDGSVDHVRGPARAPLVESGLATGEVRGTPTLFVNGSVYRGPFDAATLLEVLSR